MAVLVRIVHSAVSAFFVSWLVLVCCCAITGAPSPLLFPAIAALLLERAIACYRKCGFAEEGRFRHNHFLDGRYWDTIRMSVLRPEFEALDS